MKLNREELKYALHKEKTKSMLDLENEIKSTSQDSVEVNKEKEIESIIDKESKLNETKVTITDANILIHDNDTPAFKERGALEYIANLMLHCPEKVVIKNSNISYK